MVTASFVQKHGTQHLTLGRVVRQLNTECLVDCWILALILIAGYWKFLATVGSTLGANFGVTVLSFMHWAHGIEDTNILS